MTEKKLAITAPCQKRGDSANMNTRTFNKQ